MATYSGGYVQLPTQLIIRKELKHTEALKQTYPQIVLDALSAHQCIPWQVDPWLLDVQRVLFEEHVEVPWGTPVVREAPARVETDVWQNMTNEEKKRWRDEAHAVYRSNYRSAGQRAYWWRVFSMFDELARSSTGRPFFYPYVMDFRGRFYPKVAEGTAIGGEVATGVLQRFEGEALTETGMFWLAVGVASCYGMDKEPFETRAKWTRDNEKTLIEIADNPLDTLHLWINTDKPLRFIGLVKEYVSVLCNPKHEVKRPIHLDGTCNGFQHLSAMSLDEITGKSVNLLPGNRQDLYSDVAEHMNMMLHRDGHPITASRSQVKRAVMTTPYGITKFGMLDQMKEDRIFGDNWDLATASIFRDYLVNAIADYSGRAYGLMGWFQSVAKVAGEKNVPLDWSTPVGMRIRMAYYKLGTFQVHLSVMRNCKITTSFGDEKKKKDIDRRKHKLSSAPNVTHSFDAAHLMSVVTHPSIPRDHTPAWINTIHDSFGTLPNHVSRMRDILRETFAEQYSTDWLEVLYADWSEQLGEIPRPPERGNLDVNEIRKSDFVFS